jgi:CheY-like chemotaxis protein
MSEPQKILVVDDDVDLCAVFSETLQSNGYTVVTAADSNEAAEKIKSEKPDAVLLDVVMEEVDAGLVLAEKLGDSIPIILVSSIAKDATRVFDLHEMQVSDILQKPVKPEALLTAVKKAVA